MKNQSTQNELFEYFTLRLYGIEVRELVLV